MKTKILKWTCEICKKEIISLHEKQLDFWKKQHELSHQLKNEQPTTN
jgi:hypothetical protein